MSSVPDAQVAESALLDVWNDVLDDFESTLDHAVLAAISASDGASVIEESVLFTPPPSLPPFPRELAERARQLLARNDDVMGRLTDASTRLGEAAAGAAPNRRRPVIQRSAVSSFDALA